MRKGNKRQNNRRKHLLADKMKELSAKTLAQKIGYMRVKDLPHASLLSNLPTRSYKPNRILRFKDELAIVERGKVEIWHAGHDTFIKALDEGAVFGDMPILGQTMIGTQAISGSEGATVAVMNVETARKWLRSDPVAVIEKIGRRLASIEAEHYRANFQLADSRIAALLLELAGEGSAVEGYTHQQLGERIGMYRETVTNMLHGMKTDGLLKVGRKRITLLNKPALREIGQL